MKTYLEYINESKQIGDVYHFTSFNSMLHILRDNLLRGHIAGSSVFYALYGSHRTISTTRDKNYVNSRGQISIGGDAVFVLDGDKLATKYKRRPIDDRYDIVNKKIFSYSYGDEQEELRT